MLAGVNECEGGSVEQHKESDHGAYTVTEAYVERCLGGAAPGAVVLLVVTGPMCGDFGELFVNGGPRWGRRPVEIR